jgi:lipopolysaccharide transport system permease protein
MLLVNFIIVQRLGTQYGDGSVPPYLLIFFGFILWQLFEPSFSTTISSFVSNQALFKKLYFPRLIPAISFMASRLFDFFIAFILLFIVSILLGNTMPVETILLIIPGLIMLLLTAYGAGLLLGSLNLKFRDIQQVLPFFMRILFFGTPIIWPMSVVPENLQAWFYLNPAGAVIETLRRSWYDASSISWDLMLLPFITMTVCLILGIWLYKRRERELVDIA